MSNKALRPEDILPDNLDKVIINGVAVRKGTVGSFLANVEIFESLISTDMQKKQAKKMLAELAPSIKAVGLHKHAIFKNREVEEILNDIE